METKEKTPSICKGHAESVLWLDRTSVSYGVLCYIIRFLHRRRYLTLHAVKKTWVHFLCSTPQDLSGRCPSHAKCAKFGYSNNRSVVRKI